MKAILLAAGKDERINSVAIPGLCTGVGRMQPIISARQMFLAYEEVVLKKNWILRTSQRPKNIIGISIHKEWSGRTDNWRAALCLGFFPSS